MSSDMRWRINIKNMETHIAVGIHAHEQKPQRVVVNAVIEGMYPVKPRSIEECFSYEHVQRLVVGEWPKRPHIFLLETYIAELLQHIFSLDERIVYVKASLCKPDIFAEAEAVGVEAQWTREDFERLTATPYDVQPLSADKKVVIIGGGPAGMSCALWLKYYGMEPVIVDRNARFGGALLGNDHVNKWVLGQEGCNNMELAARFNRHIQHEQIAAMLGTDVQAITREKNGFTLSLNNLTTGKAETLVAAILVLCPGIMLVGGEAFSQVPGFPQVQSSMTFGTPTAQQIKRFHGESITVIGGGDNAYESALELAWNGCKVNLVMRAAKGRAQRRFQEAVARLEQSGDIRIIRNASITDFAAKAGKVVVTLGDGQMVESAHIFASLGYVANTQWIQKQLPSLSCDAHGFISVDEWTHTSVANVYAAGDAMTQNNPCVSAAMASGNLVARSIERDLSLLAQAQ